MVAVLARQPATQLALHGQLVAFIGAMRNMLGAVHADVQRLFAGV